MHGWEQVDEWRLGSLGNKRATYWAAEAQLSINGISHGFRYCQAVLHSNRVLESDEDHPIFI